jgi:uncharacterized membrane protein YkoI
MKKPTSRICTLAIGTVILLLLTASAFALGGEEYLSQAKLSLVEARQIALKVYPGNVVTEEIEKESGGSGLRYSFVIDNHKAKHEVGIDARTGQVLENSVEASSLD